MSTILMADISDAFIIADFNRAMALETEQLLLDENVALKGVINLMNDPHLGFYIIAKHNNTVIGSLLITYEWSDWNNGLVWWIQSVFVKNENRKQGVFKNMLNFVQEKAKEKQVIKIKLYMDKNNIVAKNTYKSQFFETTNYSILEKKL
jgi:N-acetylglutamate synthase-like GNAT family acetyltransferase